MPLVNVKIMEGGRVIGSGDDRITLRSGRHEIEIVSESHGLRQKQVVEIGPGEIKRIGVQ